MIDRKKLWHQLQMGVRLPGGHSVFAGKLGYWQQKVVWGVEWEKSAPDAGPLLTIHLGRFYVFFG